MHFTIAPHKRLGLHVVLSRHPLWFGFAFGSPRILDIYYDKNGGWRVHRRSKQQP